MKYGVFVVRKVTKVHERNPGAKEKKNDLWISIIKQL